MPFRSKFLKFLMIHKSALPSYHSKKGKKVSSQKKADDISNSFLGLCNGTISQVKLSRKDEKDEAFFF